MFWHQKRSLIFRQRKTERRRQLCSLNLTQLRSRCNCNPSFNPIWAGLWNDVVDWGGALSARIQFLEGSPLWIFLETFWKKIFWDFSGTCLTLKETKSRNLVSVAQTKLKQQTIFGHLGHHATSRPNRVKLSCHFTKTLPPIAINLLCEQPQSIHVRDTNYVLNQTWFETAWLGQLGMALNLAYIFGDIC